MTATIPRIALTVAEAAQSVGVSEPVIRAAIHRGDLHAVRLGTEPGKGDLRIGVEELARYFSRRESAS